MFKPWGHVVQGSRDPAVLVAQAPIAKAGQDEGDEAHAGDQLLTYGSRRQEGHEHAGPKITSGDIGMQRLRYS
jgi:hypothetical protein